MVHPPKNMPMPPVGDDSTVDMLDRVQNAQVVIEGEIQGPRQARPLQSHRSTRYLQSQFKVIYPMLFDSQGNHNRSGDRRSQKDHFQPKRK